MLQRVKKSLNTAFHRKPTPYDRPEECPPFPMIPEIIINILEFMPYDCKSLKKMSNFARVCIPFYLAVHNFENVSDKEFKNYDVSNWTDEHRSLQLWKGFVLQAWPNFNPDANVKNWHKVFTRRRNMERKFFNNIEERHLIDSCPEMEFKCPMVFEDFTPTGDEKIRFCNVCSKNVYRCDNRIELKKHWEKGDCVSFHVFTDNSYMEYDGGLG